MTGQQDILVAAFKSQAFESLSPSEVYFGAKNHFAVSVMEGWTKGMPFQLSGK
ncbi:MAG: hypothetical protein KDD64_03290 [Bdellovibrionales bacterium]|nr:hypothetical protein [Bdellovibrionales bacterium]